MRDPKTFERRLDLRGLKCPLPVLQARKELRTMRGGERLVVLCTDPLARIDLPHLAAELGDILESLHEADGTLCVSILKGERS